LNDDSSLDATYAVNSANVTLPTKTHTVHRILLCFALRLRLTTLGIFYYRNGQKINANNLAMVSGVTSFRMFRRNAQNF